MDIQKRALLKNAGIDTETAIARFAGNEQLYEKFLNKFISDDNFNIALQAFQNKDWNEMHGAIHTLKGVSGNLGMDTLYHSCTQTLQLLRNEEMEKLESSFLAVQNAYQTIICTLAKEGDYDQA